MNDDIVHGTGVHEPEDRFNVDHAWIWERRGEAQALEKASKEEEKFMLCKLLAKTVPLSNKEGNAALILAKLFILINESLRIELLRFVMIQATLA